MRNFKMLAAAALILPAAAIAQVGPNPAVGGGSLDPGTSATTTTDATVAGPTAPSVGVGTNAGADVTTPAGDAATSTGTTTTTTAPDDMSDMHKSHGKTHGKKKH